MEGNSKKGYNVASLTLGIISILSAFFYYISIPTGVLAIIFAVKGIKYNNSGVAKAGLICGIVGLSICALIYLFLITMILVNL